MGEPVKVELYLGAVGIDCRLIVDGEDISNKVSQVDIHAKAGEATSVTLTYPIADVTVLGDTWVTMMARPQNGGGT